MDKTENKVKIKGYVGNTPEYRTNNQGKTIVTFIIGTDDLLSNEVKKQWHSIVVTSESLVSRVRAEIVKGSRIELVGVLYYHKANTDKYYQKTKAEIIVGTTGSISVLNQETVTPPVSYQD